MTPKKTIEAFEACAALITKRTGYSVAVRMDPEQVTQLAEPFSEFGQAMNHLLFCCEEGPRMVKDGRMEKAFRWLGFVQGGIWAAGLAPLETLKKMNMPEPEEPDVWPTPEGSAR